MSTPQTLAAAHAEVKAEIARTDTKTGLRRAVDFTMTGGALLVLAALLALGGVA